MTVTTPLLIPSTEDEEEDDDTTKLKKNKDEIKYYPQNKCFNLTKFATSKMKGFFVDRKINLDPHYFLKNRKYVIALLMLVFIICYLNTGDWSDNERINVIHHSHVPGMKGKLLAYKETFIRIVGVLFHSFYIS